MTTWKSLALTVSMLMAAAVAAGQTPSTQPAAEVVATIDAADAGKPFSRDLLGVNVDSEDANEPGYRGVERYYDSLGPLDTPAVRYPGGLVANFFHWAQTLGPLDQRTKQWNCFRFAQFTPHLGAAEFLVLLEQLKARGMAILNLLDGTPEEAAAWVAFCRGRIGDTRTIGVDDQGTDWKTVDYWAQKRFELTGLLEPVNVLYWELGNELIDGKNFTNAPDYCRKALDYAKAIRRIDPNILIGWLAWDAEVLKDDRDLFDFHIIHIYTGWPRYGDRHIMWKAGTLVGEFECPEPGEYTLDLKLAAMGINARIIEIGMVPQATGAIDGEPFETVTLDRDYRAFSYSRELTAGKHRLEIEFANDYCELGDDTNVIVEKFFTVRRGEHQATYTFPDKREDIRVGLAQARGYLEGLAEGCRTDIPGAFIGLTEYNRMECACFDLETALYTAEMLRICSEIPEVRNAMIWEACSWNFGIKCSLTGVERPVYYVLQMASRLGDRILPVRLGSDNPDLQLLATKDLLTGRLAVLATNLGPQPRMLRLTGPDGQALPFERQTFICGNLTDENEQKPTITPQTRTLTNEKTIAIPGFSVNLIDSKKD